MNVLCQCGAQAEMTVSDKRGFVCDACGGLFDVYPDGTVVRSPLRDVVVMETGTRYEVFIGKFVKNDP